MDFKPDNARKLLEQFDFAKLFTEELGWDRHNADLSVPIGGVTFVLRAVAEKRGMVAWVCHAPSGHQIPDRTARKKIETQVAKTTLEHLIIFTDEKRAEQTWSWARRETGKPVSMPEHFWYASSGNRGFLQKIEAIAFSLAEEKILTLFDVTARARAAFDVERVTKRFYDQFKTEHKVFLGFISGITEVADKEWYASLMLNRLMFIYFMQRKGFLNGERDYLRDRLARCQNQEGQDKFYSFYRYFLLRLFHEGLGGKERNTELDKLLGRIPYLNGGLFEKHQIEERFPDIKIPDEAFTRIFAYFDRYQWHLDERPLRNDNEINPDVLGYIFEKYINQKQMGAYYTKEDITEYISKNTVIPFLFDAAKAKCKVAFENPGGPTIWDHLRDDPDRYIHAAVKHGTEHELPPEIAAGMQDVSARTQWNQKAPAGIALPTEIWREVLARRKRYTEVRTKLAAGEVRGINDLITLNLDIRQFAHDVIERCEGPDLLRAFWKAIEGVTVLDPTCGSGAFLFAALNILEPLYETCLDRMEAFVADLERLGEGHSPKKFEDFKATLQKVSTHPNARYFTLKSIILNNLFGVDIMEEAVEICKLRLFLKLAAQVDPDPRHENLGIEPLPDIDFNIRAGNTLVGYATYADVKKALTSKLDLDNSLETITRSAADLQQTFKAFRLRQVDGDGSVPVADKQALRQRLKSLEDKLNLHLARESGVRTDSAQYSKWLHTHQPFHWFIEFHGIMENGGFDVIVGNPPYVVYPGKNVPYSLNSYGYDTLSTKNLYSFVFERSIRLAKTQSPIGLIVQLTALSSEKMPPLQKMLLQRSSLVALSFPRRPQSVFEGVEMPVVILLSLPGGQKQIISSDVSRFYAEERPNLMSKMMIATHSVKLHGHRIGKLGHAEEIEIHSRVSSQKFNIESLTSKSGKGMMYYQEACRYWVKASHRVPRFIKNGVAMEPPHGRKIGFQSGNAAAFAAALLNSSLFYWWYSVFSDCEHVNDALVRSFPIPANWDTIDWVRLSNKLVDSLERDAIQKTINTKQGHVIEYDEISAAKSKGSIDRIDEELSLIYGLGLEEADFIKNYDIKYRLAGADEVESGADE
ncbi:MULTISPECIES: DNA methyltransferase [Rhizobium]|uniref:Eco57I restriction-modification methylase domain-containing protein n=1 Tax=Rhizobium TaxID=379 RepID=UPI001B3341A6|nr:MULTISPECIES: DNA methyltransferase [Rhizobium]MBX4912017.1 SAM-dependent methyltransferase [Rhizobium bangladeshense]MBX5260968.1 SAM-dependent methyltransferase [Rhizobium sp. NLR16b]MBX5267057.1 SAM-dependent methyltransferase [Rhizobium sp. NLR16a]MBX5315625.1 SAM-dependent methyltransferase [Rhizobium sp. NLR11b]QTU95707.1 Eco57I restriction-modification methylase domain-containing protein [Rhizobium sp. NLR16a]